jgi:uncharacterized protein YeaO (DUF488 family)
MQLAQWRLAKQREISLLDITAKSGILAFAPNFQLVMDYKRGQISEAEYTKHYAEKMEHSKEYYPQRWATLSHYRAVALTCYCPAGQFCHRHLFAKIMEEFLHKQDIPVKQMGELLPEGMNSNPPTELPK